jgi:hypothetical protein
MTAAMLPARPATLSVGAEKLKKKKFTSEEEFES